MKTGRDFEVNLSLDWRHALVMALIAVALLALVSAVGAQQAGPATLNAPEQPAASARAAAPVFQSEPPADGLVPTINGEWLQAREIVAPAAVPDAAPESSAGGRLFYVTNFSVNTTGVLTACAAGYHTASLWEVLDVSNLAYASSHPQALKKADSGQGPPSGWNAWIRTGFDSTTANSVGAGNCANWTSTSSTSYGTAVQLSLNWTEAATTAGSWRAQAFTCNFTGPVWCVGG